MFVFVKLTMCVVKTLVLWMSLLSMVFAVSLRHTYIHIYVRVSSVQKFMCVCKMCCYVCVMCVHVCVCRTDEMFVCVNESVCVLCVCCIVRD